jgi:hypothetical protein
MKLKTIALTIILGTLISCGTSFGKKKEFGNLEIFYSSDKNTEKSNLEFVNKIGQYFIDNDLVLDQKHSLKLTSDHNKFILKMILDEKLTELPAEMEQDLELLESDIHEKVFTDLNFEIEICDVNFYPLNLKK